MTHLNDIPVQFDQEQHKYYDKRTGRELKGITSTLIRRLFPNKYKDVPQFVLQKAADKGSIVHEDIELTETLGTAPSTQEGKNYLQLKAENGLTFLSSEHLVSDMENYASSIDLVFDAEDNVVDIADIKTTYRFDKESVSWQLSIYAYMLELNNPKVKVRNLYGIWLRGEIAELIPVDRHSKGEVKALIEADVEDKDYDYSPAFPEYITENEQSLYSLAKRIHELTEEYDVIKSDIQKGMSEHGDKSFDLGNMVVTLVAPSKKTSFDSKKFQAEHKDLYGQYLKTSKTKESLKVTLR